MTKSGISKLFFIILIFIYLTDQLICLNKSVFKKISSKITLVWGRGCLYKQRFFVVLFNFFFFFDQMMSCLTNLLAFLASLAYQSQTYPSLSFLSLNIPKRTYSRFLRRFWRLELQSSSKNLKIGPWRPDL